MIDFPNCKINLGLHVFEQRPDNYHPLETVFLPVPICDALEFVKTTNPNHSTSIQFYGLAIAGEPESNLVYKAWKLLHNNYGIDPVDGALYKHIPMGAGLGGGSADGAFALKILNQLFELNLSEDTLIELALQLGSDCPFFILNKPVFASARGEIMEPIAINLKGYCLVLINPGIHVSTAKAFGMVPKRKVNEMGQLMPIIKGPIEDWKHQLCNDFEKALFPLHPELGQIKTQLYELGAVYASMTGSGSTMYGLFKTHIDSKKHFKDYEFVTEISL